MGGAIANIFLSITVIAAFLFLVLMGRAKGERLKMIFGGMGVAAAIVAVALLADAFMGGGSP